MNTIPHHEIDSFLIKVLFSGVESNSTLNGKYSSKDLKRWAFETALSCTNLLKLNSFLMESELKLRFALHLSPPEAVKYDSSRSESRKTLIKDNLVIKYGFPEDISLELARNFAALLDSWEQTRDHSYGARLDYLLKRQNNKCNCCHLSFSKSRRQQEEAKFNKSQTDPFKPLVNAKGSELMEPCVDHILAISGEGTNKTENLQVLCSFCNRGKGTGFGVSISKELSLAYDSFDKVSAYDKAKLFYYRLMLDDFACSVCGSTSKELTVRLVEKNGNYTLTNLKTICYDCC